MLAALASRMTVKIQPCGLFRYVGDCFFPHGCAGMLMCSAESRKRRCRGPARILWQGGLGVWSLASIRLEEEQKVLVLRLAWVCDSSECIRLWDSQSESKVTCLRTLRLAWIESRGIVGGKVRGKVG